MDIKLVKMECFTSKISFHRVPFTKPQSLQSLHGHSVPLREKSFTKIYPDIGPPAKLSYRSAIHKKEVFGAGDAWTLPQIQGEVGGDQEPPGNTWRYPMGSKFFLLILNHI